MKVSLLAALTALACSMSVAHAHTCPAQSPQAASMSPITAKFVTSDIDLFWRAYDLSTPENMAETFDREYLARGSAGLAEFTKLRITNGKALAKSVNAAPKYYAALRAPSRQVERYKPAMVAAFQCLRAIYPQAVMPDVYFVIGRMNSGGTVDASKLLIGVDMFGRGNEETITELGKWHRATVSPIERIPFIVAHELIHAQQSNPANETLLAASLHEGVADFIAELIAGQNINPHLHAFAKTRHVELWRKFEKAMLEKDLGEWLFQGEKATAEWPADLGYYMGFRIAEAYYAQHVDKTKAIRDMLNINDPVAFLGASGYAAKMR
jgi:hypothetical protein